MNYKEFLNSKDGYKLVMLPEHAGDDEKSGLIEVPDGAESALKFDSGISFYKDNGKKCFSGLRPIKNVWEDCQIPFNAIRDYAEIIWQRPTQPEELPFIDDEPSVQATLNERQSSYGCFEDVALVTENIIDALKQVNYNRMPKTHKMAMYMIASKMARIVNGDHNFIESWHDIAGYATLMENELRVTDGATNSRLTYQKVINGKLQDI